MIKKTNIKDPMDSVLANIEKSMGKKGQRSPFARFGSIDAENVPVISFGVPEIDAASYCGGIPRGKMVEIYGPESSGKSLLSLMIIAQAQKQELECALLDVEQSFDPIWAASHGVDVSKLLYSSDFASGEEALEYATQFCECGKFGIVVVDSTAALIPKAEIEGVLTDKEQPGIQARMMSRACRKIMAALGEGNTTCIFINQIRMKIGVMYGNPETTSGGQALKFYSHQRINVRKKSQIKISENGVDVVVGQISSLTFVKNKTARPFGKAEFKVIFDPTALNPVVMLANALKGQKLVTIYKGILRISKDAIDNKTPIETGATNMVELADYLIANNQVIPLLDALIEDIEGDPIAEPIDDAILEMKTDPSKIVSPTNAKIDAIKVGDASEEEVVADIEGQDDAKDI